MRIERTKSGKPALWESGGGSMNTGSSIIICDPNGEAKPACYVKNRGHISNGQHALIVVDIGDVIINASHHRKDFSINIFAIYDILPYQLVATPIGEFNDGHRKYERAIEAAKEKATCYHCRAPH